MSRELFSADWQTNPIAFVEATLSTHDRAFVLTKAQRQMIRQLVQFRRSVTLVSHDRRCGISSIFVALALWDLFRADGGSVDIVVCDSTQMKDTQRLVSSVWFGERVPTQVRDGFRSLFQEDKACVLVGSSEPFYRNRSLSIRTIDANELVYPKVYRRYLDLSLFTGVEIERQLLSAIKVVIGRTNTAAHDVPELTLSNEGVRS